MENGNGFLPPQAIEIEEAVLGSILIEKEAIYSCVGILKPEVFYKDSNRKIYTAIINLFNKSDPIDILMVTNELTKMGQLENVGGPYAIAQLTSRVAGSSNIEMHSRIILEKYIGREIIRISHEASKEAYLTTSDILQTLSDLASNVSKTLVLTESDRSESTIEIINEVVRDVHANKDKKELTGIPTPFRNLNKRTGGWQPSDLIIIAARPAMGKTSFALQLATFPVYQHNKRIALFSLEMSKKQLVARILGTELEIKANRFTRDAKLMDLDELNQKLHEKGYVYSNELIIDDRAGIDINQLIAKCKSLHIEKKLDMIVIDYVQLLSDRSVKGNRESEVSAISRKLKVLAKDLNIPVIALAQLNRGVESRGGDRTPQLSDLRESGSIEQDADMVIFINRPEYYGLTEDADGNSTIGIAKIFTAKYRGGSTGTDPLNWKAEFTKFSDIETHQFEEDDMQFEPMSPNSDFENNDEEENNVF
jgi:replicative DNA helicase